MQKNCIEFESVKAILDYNCGSLCSNNANDISKRNFFANISDFDVEVKSWASEVGRAYYSKRFHNRISFGKKATPRKCTTLYKFFLHDRQLVRATDSIFKEYLEKYPLNSKTLPWQEQFFWEFRVPSWNGNVITGEHRYSFDITIPYNNITILELLLSVPINDRLEDKLYKEIRELWNHKIEELGISVQNVKHTKKRAIIENLYYTIHSKLPF